jgi:phosphate transport system substrate-binding protein
VNVKKLQEDNMKRIMMLMIVGILTLSGCSAADPEDTNNQDEFASEKIDVYTRDTSSGTRDGFMNGIGFGDAATDDSLLVDGFITNNNAGIMNAVATDVAGIGYVSMASVNDTIKALQFEGVEASEANVINNTYGLKRPFNWIMRSADDFATERERDLSLAFLGFLASNDGADVINDEGAIAISSTGNWATLVSDYPVCSLDNSNETLVFGGSDSISKIAEALSGAFSARCGDVKTVNNHTGSSDGYKRTQGEEKDGINSTHIGYASRPFKDTEQTGEPSTRGQLAWDAIVAIVNNDNPVDGITAQQLMEIYKGDITTWGEVLAQQ